MSPKLVAVGEVITLEEEMGPGSQKAKNTIGPDLRSFLGISLSGLNLGGPTERAIAPSPVPIIKSLNF